MAPAFRLSEDRVQSFGERLQWAEPPMQTVTAPTQTAPLVQIALRKGKAARQVLPEDEVEEHEVEAQKLSPCRR